MTDNEIIKALEYCQQQGITSECERCKVKNGCRATLIENALDLINRQKAEIERLQKYNAGIAFKHYNDGKSEAIREFAEELKKRASRTFVAYSDGYEYITAYQLSPETIDVLVKERTEGNDDELLANGVVVPPCKIGQTVWFVEHNFSVGECRVSGLTQKADETWKIRLTHLRYKSVFEIKPDAIGKGVFFTKEEAERALRERTEGFKEEEK